MASFRHIRGLVWECGRLETASHQRGLTRVQGFKPVGPRVLVRNPDCEAVEDLSLGVERSEDPRTHPKARPSDCSAVAEQPRLDAH